MDKQFFTNNLFTDYVDEHLANTRGSDHSSLYTSLTVNPDTWFQWMTDHWSEADKFTYEHNPTKQGESNSQIKLANEIGYTSANTAKLDWGRSVPSHNEDFIHILGQQNFDRLGIDSARVLIRLLCYLPGSFLPLHWDNFESWQTRFQSDETPSRFSVLINPWSWGHYLQIHSHMISTWNPGDTYEIPYKALHCSGNGGIVPKITLAITGIKKET